MCKKPPIPSDAVNDIKLLYLPWSGTIHVFLMIFKLERSIFLVVKIPGIRGTEDFQAQMARSAEFGSFQGA